MPSTDATTRRMISSLPACVSNPASVEEICVDSDASRSLEKEIQSAYRVLHDYNRKLDIELLDRKKFSMKLQDFLQAQKDLLTEAEQRLEVVTQMLSDLIPFNQSIPNPSRSMKHMSAF